MSRCRTHGWPNTIRQRHPARGQYVVAALRAACRSEAPTGRTGRRSEPSPSSGGGRICTATDLEVGAPGGPRHRVGLSIGVETVPLWPPMGAPARAVESFRVGETRS